MSAPAGWYPDPGGAAGLFRYWDGSTWSAVTTQNPASPPPFAAAAPMGRAAQGRPATLADVTPRRRSPVGWIVAIIAVVVVAAVVIVGIRLLGRDDVIVDPGPAPGPVGSPSASADPATCPTQPSAAPSVNTGAGARVISGKLSYPKLGDPFSDPYSDSRVPFGRDVQTQSYGTETSTDGKITWAASVIIATLTAGDGFYGPEQGAKLVTRCIAATFYGNAEVTRDDTIDKKTTIDGRDAWLIESHLTYDLPGIEAKGELLIVAVIDTGDGNAGLYYASIPDNASELVAPARAAYQGLRVTS